MKLTTKMSRVIPAQPQGSVKYGPDVFMDSCKLRQAFEEVHQQIRQNASEANRKNADLVLGLARMQTILSERGEDHRRVKNEAGIGHWTWTSYFNWFKREFKYELTLRTVQRNIAKLAGKGTCPECQKSTGHSPTCSRFKQTRVVQLQSRLDSIESAAREFEAARGQHCDMEQAAGKLLSAICATATLPNHEIPPKKTDASGISCEAERLAIRLAEHVVRDQLQAARETAIEFLAQVHKSSRGIADQSQDNYAAA